MRSVFALILLMGSSVYAEQPRHTCGSDFDVAFAEEPVAALKKKKPSTLTTEENIDLMKYRRIKALQVRANRLIQQVEQLDESVDSVKRDVTNAEIVAICVQIAELE